jgi:hypothetical protein
MWENWNHFIETETSKAYELVVEIGEIKVLLVVHLFKIKEVPLTWEASISVFNPGAGEYVPFEEEFSSISEAEEKAWQAAQGIENRYRDSSDFGNINGQTIFPPKRK